ncbi:MAG: hypothetical protein PVG45_00775 [Gammaproteobacteria bacterium]|jgi:hypothetical protein
MTLEKARKLIAMHVDPGSGYNRDAARMVPGEPVRDYGLEQKRQIKPGAHFESAFK